MRRISPRKRFECAVRGCLYSGRSQSGLNAHQRAHAPHFFGPPPFALPGPQGAEGGAGRIRDEDSDEDEDDENWLGAVQEAGKAEGQGEVGNVRGLLLEGEGGHDEDLGELGLLQLLCS